MASHTGPAREESRAGWAATALLWASATVLAHAGAAFASTPVTEYDPDGVTSLRSWIVAGPFPSTDLRNQSYSSWPKRTGFDADFLQELGGEAAARPEHRTEIQSPDGRTIRFREYVWNTRYVDLTEIFGRPSHVAAYLYAEIESSKERSVYLHFGSNDAAKVWVNGDLVLSYPQDRSARRSNNVLRVDLVDGRTPILVKVDQAGANWGAYVEFSETSQSLRHAIRFPNVRFPIPSSPSLSERTLSEIMDKITWVIWSVAIAGLLLLGLPFILFWLILRHRWERQRREYEMQIAVLSRGAEPPLPESPAPVRHNRTTMFIWGIVLTLGGFGLTITEIANSGFGNAGLELAIMLVGAGLLIAHGQLKQREPPSESEDEQVK